MLRYEDVPDPEPGPGEVLVELRAASLNHLDLWLRQGLPSVAKPRILGADGAGVLAGTDERVVIDPTLARNGSPCVLGEHRDGTHAELIAVPRSAVHPIPAGLSFEQAAAFPLVFETAYRMLVTKARLQPDEWVLIWGIGSGVATAALAIAHGLGARTIVTSSSRAEARAGPPARRRRDARPRRRRRARPRQGADGRRCPGRRRARRRRDVGALAGLGRPRGADRRLRGDVRAEPTGGAAPDLVARAGRVRLDDSARPPTSAAPTT